MWVREDDLTAVASAVRIGAAPSLQPGAGHRAGRGGLAITDIIDHGGSVQHVAWLDEHEKDVFKTGYEIDQEILLDRAADRQVHIDQAQSLNLFFAADASPHYISKVHKLALLDPNIKSLYYLRSRAGIQASKQK